MKESENIVDSVLEGWRRGTTGPLPQINALQLLSALIIIERDGPVGRRALSHALQIKDGVVRGLLERLANRKIVSVTETGVQLSKIGKQNLHNFLRQNSILAVHFLDGSDLVPGSSAVGIRLKGAFKPGMTGVAQRDEAIKAGAGGSIIVALLRNKLVIPPDNKSLSNVAQKENARLRELFKPSDNDLIVIGFGKGDSQALTGALAAALSLRGR